MLDKNILIRSEFITLQQLLKFANLICSGGHAKAFLSGNTIIINGVKDNRRGRKLYDGDKVVINNKLCLTVNKE